MRSGLTCRHIDHASSAPKRSPILVMEARHLRWVRLHRAEAPSGLLGASDIDDPYGLGLPEYRRARQAIITAVEMHLPELIGLAN